MSSERLIHKPKLVLSGSITQYGIEILDQLESSNSSAQSSLLSFCLPFNPYRTSLNKNFLPFDEIIWCQLSSTADSLGGQPIMDITYVDPKALPVKPNQVSIQIKNSKDSINQLLNNDSQETELSQLILSKAYRAHKVSPSILVVINPHGGQGKAIEIYENQILPILRAANVTVQYMETKYHEHAVDIARDLDVSRYDIIACCSGDGIPHQIINGFYQRPDRGLSAFENVAITQLPCGSGNALTLSTYGSNDAALSTFMMLKAEPTKLDLMAVSQETRPTKLSFLSQCFGIIADSDIGTEHLRWMGSIRFELGVVKKVLSRASYPCDIYVDYIAENKNDLEDHFNEHNAKDALTAESVSSNSRKGIFKSIVPGDLELTGPSLSEEPPRNWVKLPSLVTNNLSIFYVGKMPYISSDTQFFPAALPNDASMDMVVTDTNTSVVETTKILLSIDKGLHVHSDKVIHAKIRNYRLVPRLKSTKDHYISIDGESFPFEPLQVEILPGILTALLPNGSFVETSFAK